MILSAGGVIKLLCRTFAYFLLMPVFFCGKNPAGPQTVPSGTLYYTRINPDDTYQDVYVSDTDGNSEIRGFPFNFAGDYPKWSNNGRYFTVTGPLPQDRIDNRTWYVYIFDRMENMLKRLNLGAVRDVVLYVPEGNRDEYLPD